MYHYEVISDEYKFEEFIKDLFNAQYSTQSFQLYGVKGATQHGIDVFSTEKRIVIQCKKKDLSKTDYMLKKDLLQDFEKSLQLVENVPFDFEVFILATTTKKYTSIQDEAARLSQDKPFDIQFLSWKDIERVIHQYPELRERYYPHLVTPNSEDPLQGNIIVTGSHHMVAGRDLTVAQKITKRNEVIPDAGGRHITDQEAYKIKNEVKKYSDLMKEAELNPNPSKVWSRLYKHFQIPSYREIPSGHAEEAIKIIQIEIAKARPKVRRRNPEAWRKQFYKPIWAASRQLGMNKEEVYQFANEQLMLKKQIDSLKQLTQKQLQALDRKLKAKLKQ